MNAAPLADPPMTDARLARDHHAGMVRYYALAVRRRRLAAVGGERLEIAIGGERLETAIGGEESQAAACEDLLDELRHHRQRHRVFNRHLWRSAIPHPSG